MAVGQRTCDMLTPMVSRALLTTALLLLTACGAGGTGEDRTGQGSPTTAPPTTTPTAGPGPQRFQVQVDGKAEDSNAVFAAFFPDNLTARPGDTVDFLLPHFTGDPHTVTFGRLFQTDVTKIPPVLADQPSEGRTADVNRSVAESCFLDDGLPPYSRTGGAPACPKVAQPEFNGRQNLFNSGFLAEGERFSVKLAGDLRPGTYPFRCLIHGNRMTGNLKVAEPTTPVPSPSEVEAAGKRALLSTARSLSGGLTGGTPERALAGGRVIPNGFVAEFSPKEFTVATGATVTWDFTLTHTVSINATEDAVGILLKDPSGAVRVNRPAVDPSDSPDPPAELALFDNLTSKSASIDGGRFDGASFKSSGLMSQNVDGRTTVTYKLTFTRPGTYQIRCLVHPDMKARITVS